MKYRSTLLALAIVITATGSALGGCGGYGCGQGPGCGSYSATPASPHPSTGGACCGARALPPYNLTLARTRGAAPGSCCQAAPGPGVRQVSSPRCPIRNPYQSVVYDLPRAEAASRVRSVGAGLPPAQTLSPCCQGPQTDRGGFVKPAIPEGIMRVAPTLPKRAAHLQTAALSAGERVPPGEPSTTATLLKWPPSWAQPALEPGRLSTSRAKPTSLSALPPCCAGSGRQR